MTDRILVDRMFNCGTDRKPKWKRLRYMISGQNLQDRFPELSAHEVAMEKVGEMLKGKRNDRL